MKLRLLPCLLAAVAPCLGAPSAYAQESHDHQQTPPSGATSPQSQDDTDVRKQLEEVLKRLQTMEENHARERAEDQKRIAELEARIALLQDAAQKPTGAGEAGQPPTAPAGAEDELESLLSGAASAQAPTPQQKPGTILGLAPGAPQSFNPDISLNGDFVAKYRSREGGHPTSKFDFRELELGFSGAVDPYTRADIIATIAHEDGDYSTDLEEAYLTFLQMPYNLQARVGKFRAEFGRANPIHVHALPWPEYPFVIQRYFGEEGLSGTGAELSWLVPNKWDQFISLTYEIMNNDNDKLFAGDQADDVTHLARLKTFRDLSPTSTLEWGTSFAVGPNDHGHGSHRSMAEGFDVTYRWKPKEAGLYQSFLWQTEVMAAQAEIRGGQESSWGMYSAAEYQFARRWKFGLRYDNAQLPFNSSEQEVGYSAYLTFLQSEFLFWRLAYMYIDRSFRDDNVSDEQRVMLQVNFTLGAHPAHKY